MKVESIYKLITEYKKGDIIEAAFTKVQYKITEPLYDKKKIIGYKAIELETKNELNIHLGFFKLVKT